MSRGDGLADVDVLVLAGGLGTRIQGVLGDTPKVLAPIGDKPYLDHLLGWLASFGARRVVLSLGHLADAVIAHVQGRGGIDWVVEAQPLGTGGAIRHARGKLNSDTVMIMNGDTWIDTDLCAFVAAHRREGVDISVLCAPVDDVSRYGSLTLDGNRIMRYVEKDPATAGPGVISGGVYLFSQAALKALMAVDGPSVEADFMQKQPPGSVHGFMPEQVTFIDIGTPESLDRARGVMRGK